MSQHTESEIHPDASAVGAMEGTPAGPAWAARDRYRLLSVSVNVYISDLAMAEAIRWLLARFRVPFGTATYSVEIYAPHQTREEEWPLYRCAIGGSVQVESWYAHDLVGTALQGMYDLVPKVTRDFLLLHAGAVVRDGAALLIPGPPNIGKSSTTLELLRTGAFAYLSDEHGAMDPVTARAYPFQRPIRLDQDAVGLFPGLEERLVDRREMPVRLLWRFVRPEDVGADLAEPAEVRWIVLPVRDWEGSPRLFPISSAEAVAEMARNCFNLRVYGDRGIQLLAQVARGAQAFRLSGGTPSERAALLEARLV